MGTTQSAAPGPAASGSPSANGESGPSTSDASGPSSTDAPVGPDGHRIRDLNEVVWRLEGQDPKYHVGVCTVGEGTHKGMMLNMYEVPDVKYAVHGPEALKRVTKFYMHPDSRKDFEMIEHWQGKRTQHGLAVSDRIRLREAKLFDGSLKCAICNLAPSAGFGTKWFKIDSNHEEEPSETAEERLNFHAEKINRDRAQIICTRCEQTKTLQGSPYAQGSSRRRVVRVVRIEGSAE